MQPSEYNTCNKYVAVNMTGLCLERLINYPDMFSADPFTYRQSTIILPCIFIVSSHWTLNNSYTSQRVQLNVNIPFAP